MERSKSLSHIGYVKVDNVRLDDDSLECEDVSLRQWLDNPHRSVDSFECFHIFRQIVDIVNVAHSKGIVVHNVRPSCFVMSSFNHVSFIESAYCSDEELSWYTSPEEDHGSLSTCVSDIYRLGVVLFELYCPVSSNEEKSRVMSSLRHRVLPPRILLNWPKEASFCLWLLHPEPTYRPSMSEVLQSEFINDPRENSEEREAVIELRDVIEEHELLLEFLMIIQQKKQEAANNFQDTVSLLSSDIDQVVKRQLGLKQQGNDVPSFLNSRKQEISVLESSRLMRNFKKMESVYFTTRHRQINDSRKGEWIDPFLEGLCKYLTFTKLRMKADLKQGDLLNSSNLVCAIAFDRDGEFFATAGVNKKIKVFECESIINDGRDIHYPVVELSSCSKLSGICWNSYIKSQIASSNFEGVVQVWDVARSQLVTEMKEHEKRVWSIDISSADPTLLASGSDDGSVKLWSINQGVCIGTIKTKANVCCVQFPLDSGRSLAFGSADHKVYYYDLRSPKLPLCTMVGHNKTVSYVKFLDSSILVSSSTDSTMKLWDLSMSVSGVNEMPIHSFMGHTNLKNFVGLSVSDGYITTGSETNEVFVYHKAFPMPVLSYKFKNIDPVSGHEIDDASQFISSVCWRGKSSTLVAANSTGNIKILEMV